MEKKLQELTKWVHNIFYTFPLNRGVNWLRGMREEITKNSYLYSPNPRNTYSRVVIINSFLAMPRTSNIKLLSSGSGSYIQVNSTERFAGRGFSFTGLIRMSEQSVKYKSKLHEEHRRKRFNT